MIKQESDTICAIATATGRAGIGIVRLSGPKAVSISEQIIGITLKPRRATLANMRSARSELIDSGIALFFKSPHSFTGEDVVELQGHGGSQVLISILDQCVALGARLAAPGEFSERAFLNGKIDLLQAEAIADLIDASSAQAARSAMRTLQGVFSEKIRLIVQDITIIRANIEAAIDFSDEDIDIMGSARVSEAMQTANQRLTQVFQVAQQGLVIKDGITVVLAGIPNAGKSSLLNALAGTDTAIVTNIPGTTRDVLRQEINLNGLPVHIIDTAGLRHSENVVEREGVKRAISALNEADLILLVTDSTMCSDKEIVPIIETLFAGNYDSGTTDDKESLAEIDQLLGRLCVVFNKIDLISNSESGVSSTNYRGHTLKLFRLSAKTTQGLNELRDHLIEIADYEDIGEGNFSARERHLTALSNAQETLSSAISGLGESLPLELVAEDLRRAQDYLGAITGEVTSDDLLGEIFSSFCIGK